MRKQHKPKVEFICYCNSIEKKTVVDAIRAGCRSLSQIFDRTTAGCGPCGGSCQPDIKKLLADEEKNK